MLSMSMRWNIDRTQDPAASIREIQDGGYDAVEVCGLTEAQLPDFQRLLDQGLKAYSVHGPCPDNSSPGRQVLSPGDWLASSDADKRAMALEYALKSVDFCRTTGIRHLVMHLGNTEIQPRDAEIFQRVVADEGGSASTHALRATYRQERAAALPAALERVKQALDMLLRRADGRVTLCLENRYRFDQLPSSDDARVLMDLFGRQDVRYWHDIGHAHAQLSTGMLTEDPLPRMAPDVAGTHLHDAVGTDDHRNPFTGEIDFRAVARLLPPGTVNVVEIDPRISLSDVRQSRERLLDLGF